MILLIDNYDSFTFNLQRYVRQLGCEVLVVRNDDNLLETDLARGFAAVILSPGPKRPKDAGACLDVIRTWSGSLPMLGVCLGHQAIFEAFGGTVSRSGRPIHGRVTEIELEDSPRSPIFEGLPLSPRFARYHSLVCEPETLPSELRITAWSDEGDVMAVEHRVHATFGVQFHPESVLSEHGFRLLENFLRLAGMSTSQPTEPDVSSAELSLLRALSQSIVDGGEHTAVLPGANGRDH